jgi:hypothetical protein
VADWLGIDGIRIEFDDSPSGPAPGDDLALGRRVSLSEARSLVDFDLAVPGALGEPDGVFHNRYVAGGEVTMTYRPNARFKESGHTEVGALFSQFVGSLEPSAVKKIVQSGTRVIGVEIDGAPGWWIEGKPHLLYRWTDGAVRDVTSRLAGNTLVWQRDGIAYRLEARTTRAEAVEIARSVE